VFEYLAIIGHLGHVSLGGLSNGPSAFRQNLGYQFYLMQICKIIGYASNIFNGKINHKKIY
jgi:hypothetical protein